MIKFHAGRKMVREGNPEDCAHQQTMNSLSERKSMNDGFQQICEI